jgi:hypothetical protein
MTVDPVTMLVTDALERRGYVHTNAQRMKQAIREVWKATCDMDLQQLNLAEVDQEVGQHVLELARWFGRTDGRGTRHEFP